MIPRYLPAVSLRDRLQASREGSPESATRLIQLLLPRQNFPVRLPVAALRDGLNAYFAGLALRAGTGAVLMSAQVCPLVPLAARYAGFAPRFVDTAEDLPVPGGGRLAAALDDSVKAVVVAPLYGHAATDLDALARALGRVELFLDLAQGIGLVLPDAAVDRADAVGYSFGIGKGIDTGGGLLLTRSAPGLGPPATTKLGTAAIVRSAALRAVVACGLYRTVARMVERAAQAAPEDFRSGVRVLEGEWPFAWWRLRVEAFIAEVAVARRRAAALLATCGRHPKLAHPATCFSAGATHLRQIIRVADPGERDRIVVRLRARGVDCAPAGEPLPSRYIAGERGAYPCAERFLADSIRLPFLGRLSERQFAVLVAALERALG